MKFFLTALSIFLVTKVVSMTFEGDQGDQGGSKSWTQNPFEQKVFIENKGQFVCQQVPLDENTKKAAAILYGASSGGINIFFTAGGLTYQHDETVPVSHEEEKTLLKAFPKSHKREIKEGKKIMKKAPHYLSIKWEGANPNAEVIAEDPVSFYYTYSGATSNHKANAFKKIIYKNLYPNIDVEYFFPSDKGGIKYSLILHPGADPSIIKIKYDNASSVILDPEGNIVIQNALGKFIDHAPQTFYADNHEIIPSVFSIKNNSVSFSLSPSSKNGSQTIIIDPWISNPTFAGYNASYDVNYDQNGNVYVYGSYSPFKLAKFNNTGALQWTYNAIPNFGLFIGVDNYGDFAVDEISGSSYLVEGIGIPNGSRVIKVSSAGVAIDTLPGNPNFQEMWRVEYNRCIGKIVIAGGGHQGTSQGAVLDTTFTTLTPINVLSDAENFHDMILLAIDNNSNSCYMATSKSESRPSNYDNVMVKCPIPGLIPINFSVTTGHKFAEVKSIRYINNITSPIYPANGFNGMAVSPAWLYTYNSDTLKRWNKNTGALVTSIKVSPATPIYHPSLGGIQIFWAGISADECDNIYIGVVDSVRVYNSALVRINTIALPDTVYDVKLGGGGKLYACGKGFVTEINVPQNNITASITSTPAYCGVCDGTATVNSISCGGSSSGFAYTWNTFPVQNTQIATGLCVGNYSVTLTSNCFFSLTGTVSVGGSGALTSTLTSTPVTCNASGTATINTNGGTTPYFYLWNTGETGSTATGLAAGTYSVVVSDINGCTFLKTVVVSQPPAINAALFAVHDTCSNSSGSAYAVVSGGISPFTYRWSNNSTNSSISNLVGGTYSFTVTDGYGCRSIKSVTVNSNTPALPVNISSNDTILTGNNTTLSITGAAFYTWTPSTGLSCNTCANPVASPTLTTVYTVNYVDANGCTGEYSVTIFVIEQDLHIPNVFTPNGSGINETFFIVAKGYTNYEIVIYNRWGQKVFESNNSTVHWNGRVMQSGVEASDGTYYYVLKLTDFKGKNVSFPGFLTLIR